ncbi:hypothetical protein HAX54_025407 [Datura stramonium]|uniref:Bifunctional inhibitor/plant lipid transfer protein/seed storage helical domain-containing protein n=1 Tax=Datura stramonium TaxID=4076 RepID=A0ABS8V1G0_DATST|nr:hypothetical protein [Datura stramonium]
MRPSSFSLVVILSISFLLLRSSSSVAAVKCTDVAKPMKLCIDWMTTGYKRSVVPPKTCCDELLNLNNMGINPEEEIAICECVKSEMQGLNIIDIVAESLSGLCGVLLPFPITPKLNCSEINATNIKY